VMFLFICICPRISVSPPPLPLLSSCPSLSSPGLIEIIS
jgi:hypothetical protein